MIPFPILAAQRGGRGIRPWWTTCRYLGWAGLIGSLAAVFSGLALGRFQGRMPLGALWGAAEPGVGYLFRIHELGGAACLLLGALCLRSLYRNRQEHQGIGVPALLLGLVWCATALTTSYSGFLCLGREPVPGVFLAPARAYAGTQAQTKGLSR